MPCAQHQTLIFVLTTFGTLYNLFSGEFSIVVFDEIDVIALAKLINRPFHNAILVLLGVGHDQSIPDVNAMVIIRN